jgi:cytosine/adenosine deaminase-related metal-dependent hydrolase
MPLYLRDVTRWNPDTGRLEHGDLVVESGPGGAVAPARRAPAPGDTVRDCRGLLAIDGLTCAHHHLYSALARGMPAPPRAPRDFAEILELVWWRLDRSLDADMVRASALAGAMDALRCGVTRIVDHHASPFATATAQPVMAEALDEVGVSHVLCLELSDRDGPAAADAGLEATDAYLSSGRPGMVGLHASFTVGDHLLRRAVDLARRHGVGIHMHVAEDHVDQRRCLDDHGVGVVHRLADHGVLDLPGTLLAHCIHIDEQERALLGGSGAWVVHNHESNLNNGVGLPGRRGLAADRLLTGTDGLHGDMLRAMRASYLAGQSAGGVSPGDAWNTLANNRRYLDAHHPAAARANDLVLLAYDPPTPLTDDNLPGHACFGLDARHVRAVIAGGRVVVDDGRLTTIDEPAVRAFCREQARRLWAAMSRI